jgi:hypothetical protein
VRFEILGTLVGTVEAWRHLDVRTLGLYGALLEASEFIPPRTRLEGRLTVSGRRQDVQAEVRHGRPVATGKTPAGYLIGVAFTERITRPMSDLLFEQSLGSDAGTLAVGERRRSGRMHVSGDAEFGLHTWADVELRDLSVGGAMVTSGTTLEPGSRGQLRTRLGERRFAADVEVRRVEPHAAEAGRSLYRIATSFVSLDEENRQSLKAFLTASES